MNDTFATDHWGYSRETGTNSFRIRFNTDNGSLYDQMADNTDKSPDYEFTNRYGLTKIIYPTGGYTEIEYGPNAVSRLLDREEGALPYLRDSATFVPGGVRVEKIKNVSTEHCDSTTFHYVTGYGDVEQSSGILLYMPRYTVDLAYDYYCNDLETGNDRFLNVFTENTETGYTVEGSLGYSAKGGSIGYSYVTAISSDGSRTDYSFYDYDDYPDVFCGHNDFIQRHRKTNIALHDYINYSAGSNQSMGDMILPPSEDKGCIRGRLKKKTEYTGNRMIETEYTYRLDTVCTIRMAQNAVYDFVTMNYVCNQCLLTAETVKETVGNKMMQTTTEYVYNSYGQIKTKTTSSNTGDGNQVRYRYWHELSGSYLPSLISDIVKLRLFGNDAYLTESKELSYGNLNNPNPTQIRSYKIEKPILVTNINNVFVAGRNNGYRQIDIIYNNKFRPTSVSSPGNTWVHYTWDSDGINLLAKEENLSGYKYLYQWKDLVGLTDVTAPSRETTRYTYDARNRLATEWDTKGNPLYHFFYKLKSE